MLASCCSISPTVPQSLETRRDAFVRCISFASRSGHAEGQGLLVVRAYEGKSTTARQWLLFVREATASNDTSARFNMKPAVRREQTRYLHDIEVIEAQSSRMKAVLGTKEQYRNLKRGYEYGCRWHFLSAPFLSHQRSIDTSAMSSAVLASAYVDTQRMLYSHSAQIVNKRPEQSIGATCARCLLAEV